MKTIEYSISEADAVRHLIVCDTQFTWAGVTNLTMPQMMDLQARGWVVEGDDNDEFQLTEAGEAVVARALQHGVPKTLADVQPGGRVRLGDQAERARFEKWMTDVAKIIVGSSDPYPAGLERDYWRVWQAALSARQPVVVDLPESLHDRVEALREVAARQPAGEPVCFIHPRDAERLRTKELSLRQVDTYWSGISDSIPVYLGRHAQDVDLGQFRPFIVEARNNAYAFIETMRKAGRDSSDAREKAALTERLLDLIDSQAVGNG